MPLCCLCAALWRHRGVPGEDFWLHGNSQKACTRVCGKVRLCTPSTSVLRVVSQEGPASMGCPLLRVGAVLLDADPGAVSIDKYLGGPHFLVLFIILLFYCSTFVGWPQWSPTFGPPERKIGNSGPKHFCDLSRKLPRTEIQITSCPSKRLRKSF